MPIYISNLAINSYFGTEPFAIFIILFSMFCLSAGRYRQIYFQYVCFAAHVYTLNFCCFGGCPTSCIESECPLPLCICNNQKQLFSFVIIFKTYNCIYIYIYMCHYICLHVTAYTQ